MKTPKHSLRKIVAFLNEPDEEGGFWLPNIQRPFVWSEEQICRLFDSILREYPISTLLIWKTKSKIRHRKFIDNFHEDHRHRLIDFYVPENDKKKCLVLDGQQRLQSLFIGLKGSYNKKELYFDILSGEIAAPDDIKYKFAFLEADKTHFPWIKFKTLVFSELDPLSAAEEMIKNTGQDLTTEERKKISRHVGLVFKAFHSDDGIGYQELDSTENQTLYTEDDVVEVFIRANSGGTKLGKSDLLFSLLTSSWDNADDQMETLLQDLNRHGFSFTRDFILKTCLTLLDCGARYEVEKFRKTGIRENIEGKWDEITKSVKDVLDFVRGKTFIRCDKAMSSYLVLIPLVYLRYHFVNAWKQSKDVDSYLLRTLLAGAFSGTPDQLIDKLVEKIKELKGFDLNEVFGVIRNQNRSLELTEDRFWEITYNSDTIHLLFNLWYRDFNYDPAYENNMPQIDHIFCQKLLKQIKVKSPETGRLSLLKYHEFDRNQLANCMLLSREENGPGGKWDKSPCEWFKGKSGDYLKMHLIPEDQSLWQLDRFEDFISARKKLIQGKFNHLIMTREKNKL
ncbi:MAG: DUF262 domain-containing protein [bacterium]